MLLFNELKVTLDGKYLIVDALVEDLEYFEDVYIDTIYFDTQDTFSSTGPSSKAVLIYNSDTETEKQVRIVYDIDLLGDNLFFIYVIAKGDSADDTPCGINESSIIGVTYYKYPIYKTAMSYLNELEGCSPAVNLIDFILRLKAFDLSIITGNFTKAISYWKLFFTKTNRAVTSKCGCNGKWL